MKTQIFGLLAAAGLLSGSANAGMIMNFSLTATMPATNSPVTTGHDGEFNGAMTTKYTAVKVKVTNKDILKLLAEEKGEVFPLGATLIADADDDSGHSISGHISVCDKTGTNYLYQPDFTFQSDSTIVTVGTESYSWSDTETKYTEKWSESSTKTFSMVMDLNYGDSSTDRLFFFLYGQCTAKDSYTETSTENYIAASTYTEKGTSSVSLSAVGDGYANGGGGMGVFSGKVSGTQKYSHTESY